MQRIHTPRRGRVATACSIVALVAIIATATPAFAQTPCRTGSAATTQFADVTGDGRADAIVINENGITVRRSTGSNFSGNETWTEGAYYGELGTFFADVTGDRKADAIVINRGGVTIRRSDGRKFLPNEQWTEAYYGNVGTPVYFADVTGDGMADAIVINDGPGGAITVRRSDGSTFLPNETWRGAALSGERGTFFADLNGDGRADLIAGFQNSVTGIPATKKDLDGVPATLSRIGYYGSRGTYFVDVTGDGQADGVVVNTDRVTVRRGKGFRELTGNEPWTEGAYYGDIGTYFADVTGDGKADAIVVNSSGVTVRRSTGVNFSSNETWTSNAYFGSRKLC